jgi:hypothetical protein
MTGINYIWTRSGQYLKTFEPNGWTIGVFHRDGIGMNVDPKDCYIKESK